MATQTIYKKSRREQVYDRLYEAISAPDSYEGKRLAPVKNLSVQFGTSVRTVQLALEQLEKDGYVHCRHGVGTFVARQTPRLTVGDHVVVAMQIHAEVWGLLSSRIIQELHDSGRVPISIDMSHRDAPALLHRAARGDVGTFIILGSRPFPFDLLQQPAFRNKQIIAVDEWASDYTPPRMHQVLHDYAYGGQELARYLHEQGHRRVIVVAATDSMHRIQQQDQVICGASRGRAFIAEWTARGGTWVTLPVRPDSQSLSGVDVDLRSLLEELTAPAGPDGSAPGSGPATAIFGFRDADAWTVQSLLQRHRPDLLPGVEIVGYGDTFWSRTARPPLTSVAYPVEDMAQWVRQLFDTALAGQNPTPSGRILVRPQLIDRSRHPLRTQPQLQPQLSTITAPAPDLHHGALVPDLYDGVPKPRHVNAGLLS